MEIIDTVLLNLLWFISPTFNPNKYKQNWDSNIEWNDAFVILEYIKLFTID